METEKILEGANKLSDMSERIYRMTQNIKVLHIKMEDIHHINEDLMKKVEINQKDISLKKLLICIGEKSKRYLLMTLHQILAENYSIKDGVIEKEKILATFENKMSMLLDKLSLEKDTGNKLTIELKEISLSILVSKDSLTKLATQEENSLNELRKKEKDVESLSTELRKIQEDEGEEMIHLKKEHIRITELTDNLHDLSNKKQKDMEDLCTQMENIRSELKRLRQENTHFIRDTPYNLLVILNEVREILNSDENSQPKTSTDKSLSTSQIASVETTYLIEKYMMELKASLGRVVTSAVTYQQQNQLLESELRSKNDQIKIMNNLIGPFWEQLKEFEQEHEASSKATSKTKKELERAALEQAAWHGHQNEKQKIKYVVRMKQQNLRLKDEVNDLQAKIRERDRYISKLSRGTSSDDISALLQLRIFSIEDDSIKEKTEIN